MFSCRLCDYSVVREESRDCNSTSIVLHSIAWPGQRPYAAMPRVRRLESQSSLLCLMMLSQPSFACHFDIYLLFLQTLHIFFFRIFKFRVKIIVQLQVWPCRLVLYHIATLTCKRACLNQHFASFMSLQVYQMRAVSD